MRIKQVFQNLIKNSIQAIKGEGEIYIQAENVDDNVQIRFKDNGEGIEEEVADKVFEPLFTTKAKGIGLGMAIVKDIIEHHKGSIELNGKKGQGTEIIITIPEKTKTDQS
ncbi:MAG: sensor histidine kinase [Atribacterota bacterium]